jgi:hypothetical protein
MFARCLAAAAGLGLFAAAAAAQQPAPQARPGPTPAELAATPVGFIYGNVPITRQDLGEFLIARGGTDKLELLVNKMIIEHECRKRGVTVTAQEMEAALLSDVEGLSIKKADFVKVVLPRYGKTLYEWMEDVIKPRLLLTKLCSHRVKLDKADLDKQFEREYGEKRRVQIIMWPKGDDLKAIEREYAKIRSSQEEFDRAARAMANPSLAAAGGHIKPISRHVYAEDPKIEKMAFELKPGEVSQIIQTSQGYVVMKLHEIIPPNATVKREDVMVKLEKQAMEEKLTEEIPKCFAELKTAAQPKLLLDGPPLWKTDAAPGRPIEDVMRGPGTAAPPQQPAGGGNK